MTTNLNAIAGPSRHSTITPTKMEPVSPASSLDEIKEGSVEAPGGISKSGMSVGEDGEVVKIPAFLNKLFTMVSDPDTNDLIYWSESGDSFFVPNHERFGKELLPRFFKHSNFSSFVRQLNMYGFHKVPHLQAGVLKNDAPSELWEFVNPHFKRGQEALLAKVTRKNNRPPQPGGAVHGVTRPAGMITSGGQTFPVHLITDGTTEGEASSGSLIGPKGQVLDLSAITSGIAAIQRTQATIGADLKALQSSNELLWREAMEQREKHRKHSETIDLIVNFLERLFGTEGQGLATLREALRRGFNNAPADGTEGESRKRRRLGVDRMISDGRDGYEDDSAQVVELPSVESYAVPRLTRAKSKTSLSNPPTGSSDWPSASQRFTALPADDEPSSRSSTTTRRTTPGADQMLSGARFSPLSETEEFRPPSSAVMQYPSVPQTTSAPPLSPNSTAQAAAAFNLDPSLLQTTIGSLLQSPAAAQMFLNSLNSSAQGQALQTPIKSQPSTGFTPQPHPEAADPTMALFSPLPNQAALMANQDALMKQYHNAMGVNDDVEGLQQSIDELVRSMGLDIPADPNAAVDPRLAAGAVPLPQQGIPGQSISGAPASGGQVDAGAYPLGSTGLANEADYDDISQFLADLENNGPIGGSQGETSG